MTAVALPPGEVLAPATTLPDVVSAAAVAALTLALGRAPTPGEMAALVRRGDGRTWLLGHRVPVVSRAELGANADRPWAVAVGMRFRTEYGPIGEVAAILLDPSSPDAEVARRLALHEEMLRDQAARQAQEEAERRAAGAAQEEERRRRQRASLEFREDAWDRLPRESRVLYSMALDLDGGADPAGVLRRTAAALASRGPIPFPGRRWW